MRDDRNGGNLFLMITRGVTLTVLVTLVCILLFALVVKLACLGTGVIKGVNQFLKVFSIFIGVFFTVKGKFGFLKGAIIGLFSTVLTFLLFALIGNGVVSPATFFIDGLFGAIIGLVCGVIAVQRKSQEE